MQSSIIIVCPKQLMMRMTWCHHENFDYGGFVIAYFLLFCKILSCENENENGNENGNENDTEKSEAWVISTVIFFVVVSPPVTSIVIAKKNVIFLFLFPSTMVTVNAILVIGRIVVIYPWVNAIGPSLVNGICPWGNGICPWGNGIGPF